MISSKRVLIPLGLAAAVATIGACTTGQAVAQSGEPPIGAIVRVVSHADIVLPLDAYMMTGQQLMIVSTAVTTIGRGCMNRFGLSWPAAISSKVGGETGRNARRYAVIELQQAKVVGYHLFQTTTPPADQKTRPADQKQPTADAMNVWAGKGEQTFNGLPVPAGGCAGEALQQLTHGVPDADASIPELLQLQTFKRTTGDSRVIRGYAEWSKCMKAKGYSYPDPYVAAGDQRWQTAKAGPTEIAVATADVTCKSATNLPGIMLAVETAYQNRAIEQQATKLAAIKSYNEIELANAVKFAR